MLLPSFFKLDVGHAYALDLSAYWYAYIGYTTGHFKTLEHGFEQAEKIWRKTMGTEIKKRAAAKAFKQQKKISSAHLI